MVPRAFVAARVIETRSGEAEQFWTRVNPSNEHSRGASCDELREGQARVFEAVEVVNVPGAELEVLKLGETQ